MACSKLTIWHDTTDVACGWAFAPEETGQIKASYKRASELRV